MTRNTLCSMLIVSLLVLSGCAMSEEEIRREEARAAWFNSLTPEQQMQFEAARLQALGMALSGGGPMMPPPPFQPVMQSAPRNCTFSRVGNQIYQNCY